MKQVHTCRKFKCLHPDKFRRWSCKCRAPWDLADDDWVDENGNWGPRCTYGYLNSWVPDISVAMRCNNDGKFLTNGHDMGNITFKTDYSQDLQNRNCLLLIWCIHAINGQQEIAAPMVMMYLMGWGNVFCSHNYQPVYWTSFVQYLFSEAPDLCPSTCHSVRCTFDGLVEVTNIERLSIEGMPLWAGSRRGRSALV